jgi:NitT/TauT family transport system substrate-binding protein
LLPAPAVAGEEPPETTAVRFMRTPSICHAPQFVIEDLLRAEGFTDVQYVYGASSAEINEAVVSGKVDFNTHFAPQWVSVADDGGAVTVLSGVHVGCFELFGREGIRSIANTTPRTRSGITHCGCMNWVSSNPAHRRSLPTPRTGVFSTSSSAS